MGPFVDYDGAAVLTGYTPGYVKLLCDRRQLGFIIRRYFRGRRLRKVRLIPHGELVAFLERRYMPPVAPSQSKPKGR